MYALHKVFSGSLTFAIMTMIALFFINTPSTAYGASMCVADLYVTDTGSGTELTLETQNRAGDAVEWIYSMMEIIRPLPGNVNNGVTTVTDTATIAIQGTITPTPDYNAEFTGAVSGTFDISALNPVVGDVSDLVITNPTLPLADSYRGVVTGTADSGLAGTHEVRMFLETDAHYDQTFFVGVSQIDPTTGTWSIDLAPLNPAFAGSISFGVFEIGPTSGNTTSETQVGLYWPFPYQDYQVESYTVADATYLVGTTPATSDNAWSFDSSFTGAKYIAIRNTATNTIVAEYTGAGAGLVRSFVLEPGDAGYGTSFESRSYMYDQALALSVAISEGDDSEAHTLAAGMIASQRDGTTGLDTPAVAGAYPFSAPQNAPEATDPYIRVGAHAIATYSMLKYIQAYPASPIITEATQSITDALAYTDTKLVTAAGLQQGLYTGGNGLYSGGGTSFDATYVIPWASTEHNLDMWHTLTLAAKVLGGTYQTEADNLRDAIVNNLWNTDTNRFYQGIANATTPDGADALDTNSWGAIFLSAIGDYEKAGQALDRVDVYKHTRSGVTGWAPYDQAGQYPGATPTVWFEGTYGVSLSFLRAGLYEEYLESLAESEDFQSADGSFVYATDLVTAYEISDYDSVASTAWYVLATTGRDNFWAECTTDLQPTDGSSVDDFYTINGSPAPAVTSSGGGSGKAGRVCRDPEASNYEQFGTSDDRLCKYEEESNSTDTDPAPRYQQFTKNLSFVNKDSNETEHMIQLERFLNEYEGESLALDGEYGEEDLAAVKRFQLKYRQQVLDIWGLTEATGFVGITTRLKLNALLAPQNTQCPLFTEHNRPNSNDQSSEVRETQRILQQLGMFTGDLTGVYDANTTNSMIAFQERFNATMLDPWGITKGTGYKYKTTNRFLNYLVGCELSDLELDNGATVSY